MPFIPRSSLVLLVLVWVAASAPVRAEVSATDRTLARSLFEEGRRFTQQGRHEDACPKFAESFRLDPASGTQINLAVCHEKVGLTATAWAEFNDALSRAREDRRADREKLARTRLAALEPVLSKLEVVVPAESRIGGLRVTLDGVEVREPAWGVSTPTDPGEHVVEATAHGRRPWTSRVVVGDVSDRQTIEVPVLELIPVAPAKKDVAPRQPVPASPLQDTGASQPALGWFLGGVGIVGLGAGAYFGIQAKSKWSDVEGACPDGRCPDDAARVANAGLQDEAARSGTISTVAFVAGAACLAAG
ncbi:MAG: hypothetical protein CVU63_12830, partial [Deltaproteobacteria bacterium HGW-Deltaproteobacteria-20]